MDENKSWMKIVYEKKAGGFTKLIEAMSVLDIELVDTNVTTIKGALLVTSCIKVYIFQKYVHTYVCMYVCMHVFLYAYLYISILYANIYSCMLLMVKYLYECAGNSR